MGWAAGAVVGGIETLLSQGDNETTPLSPRSTSPQEATEGERTGTTAPSRRPRTSQKASGRRSFRPGCPRRPPDHPGLTRNYPPSRLLSRGLAVDRRDPPRTVASAEDADNASREMLRLQERAVILLLLLAFLLGTLAGIWFGRKQILWRLEREAEAIAEEIDRQIEIRLKRRRRRQARRGKQPATGSSTKTAKKKKFPKLVATKTDQGPPPSLDEIEKHLS